MFPIASVISVVCCTSVILDGGLLLEQDENSLFLTRRKHEHNFIIHRPLPFNTFTQADLKDCRPSKCRTDADSENYNKRECTSERPQQRLELFKQKLQSSFDKRVTQLSAEIDRLRQRRTLGLGTILYGATSLGLKIANTKAIIDLRKVSLHQTRRIDELQKAFKRNNAQVELAINQTYDVINDLSGKICNVGNAMAEHATEAAALDQVDRYLAEVESEVIELMSAEMPKTLEYMCIFTNACLASCSSLPEVECKDYCAGLFKQTPETVAPEFAGIQLGKNELTIHFKMTFPEITTSRLPLFKVKSFGLIHQSEERLIANIPEVSKAATSIGGQYKEIELTGCNRAKNLVCDYAAIKHLSCLNDPATCTIARFETKAKCTYAYTSAGLVVNAMDYAEHRVKTSTTSFSRRVNRFTGYRHFIASNSDEEIACGNDLLIPVPKTTRVVEDNVELTSSSIKSDFRFKLEVEAMKLDLRANATFRLENDFMETESLLEETRLIGGASITFCFALVIVVSLLLTRGIITVRRNLKKEITLSQPLM